MRLIKLILILFPLLIGCHLSGQSNLETAHLLDRFSFETEAELKSITCNNSEVTQSTRHYKDGQFSLKWSWNNGGSLLINQPVGYDESGELETNDYIPIFAFWVYSEKVMPNKSLRFNFQSDNKVECWFDFKLDFTGWRAGWVSFDNDMEGTPVSSMNRITIVAPEDCEGELFFDNIIPIAYTDSRFPMADYQLPFVNSKAWDHWVVLYKNSLNEFDTPVNPKLTADEITGIQLIEKRIFDELTPTVTTNRAIDIKNFKLQFETYNIKRTKYGITGDPVWYPGHFQLYLPKSGTVEKLQFDGLDLRDYTNFMGSISRNYSIADSYELKRELADLFIDLVEHLFDQGYDAGSGTGTLTHSGYAMRNYYTSLFLMRDELEKAGLRGKAQKAMEWFSGASEVKVAPKAKGISADAFNTTAWGRLLSILMISDIPEKATYLKSFSRYIDNGLMFADGLEDFLKPDGSAFHHASLYPAYATGGFDGATKMVTVLNETDFDISAEARENLKNALLMMRLYCNLKQWPLALSARHPTGRGELVPEYYARMALTGTPDRSEKIDRELAAAYLRLVRDDKENKYKRVFEEMNISAEDNPSGNWSMNYASLGIHRRDNWLATVRGHSRYLWAAESYIGANYYGRYLTYGHLQILGSGEPVTNFNSGFRMEGWDWNRWPGTTTIHLPLDELKANIIKPCPRSGFEEMLLSDEAFAGAININNENGAFAMKLHEHDKYNGSHRANKSVFFFNNRIVCLGSNIKNDVEKYITETTLFQNHLSNENDSFMINGELHELFPFSEEIYDSNWNYISDNCNNFYFIHPRQKIRIYKQLQESRDQATCEITHGNFLSALLCHGKAPEDESYEYVILVNSSAEEASSFNKKLQNPEKPYEVLQKDHAAHIVWDRETDITAYMLFESNREIEGGLLLSNSAPCMVMVQENMQKLELSLCDPDLHLYDGPPDDLIIDGKRQERGVYSRYWYYNPAMASEVSIIIKGRWSLTGKSDFCNAIIRNDDTTQLTFSLKDGIIKQVELIKQL